jgi:hypothetical protein
VLIAVSSYSSPSDLDDNDDSRHLVTIHSYSLATEDIIEPDEDFNRSKNKSQLNKSIVEQESTINLPEEMRDLMRENLYKFIFMPISKQFTDYIECRLIRNKSGLFHNFRLEVDYEDNGRSVCI